MMISQHYQQSLELFDEAIVLLSQLDQICTSIAGFGSPYSFLQPMRYTALGLGFLRRHREGNKRGSNAFWHDSLVSR